MALVKGKQLVAGTITNREADTTTGTNSTINAGDAAVDGSADGLSNKAHQHAVATGGSTASIDAGDSAAEGSSSNLAREDHQHAVSTAAPGQGIGGSNAEGVATTLARSDHDHTLRETGGATDLTIAVIADGNLVERSGTTLAGTATVSDSQHGNRGGGSLHSTATTGVAGFMSAADKTKLDTLQNAAGIDAKESVRVRAQGNLTLSGEQTIDGVLTSSNRILVGLQTTPSQDGIYVTASGAWTRAADAPTGAEARGWIIHVEEGTSSGDTLWQCTNNQGTDVVGTDGLTFAQIGSGSPRGAGAGLVLNGNDIDVANADGSITVNADNILVGILQTDGQHGNLGGGALHADVIAGGADGFMTGSDKTKLDGITAGADPNLTENVESLTTETITGTDTGLTDTLTNTPSDVTKVAAYLNGIKQVYGAGNDFTVSGTTLTWLASTGTAVDMETSDGLEVVYTS